MANLTIGFLAVNYRLKGDDISYIFSHSDVEVIIADDELVPLLDIYRQANPSIPIIVDTDTDVLEGQFNEAILEGLKLDQENGGKGWDGLDTQVADEEAVIALAYTSGTT